MKKLFQTIKEKVANTSRNAVSALKSNKGELATQTIGAIIVGVVLVGLLIVAINSFFPSFFTDMFNKMSTKLNANW